MKITYHLRKTILQHFVCDTLYSYFQVFHIIITIIIKGL